MVVRDCDADSRNPDGRSTRKGLSEGEFMRYMRWYDYALGASIIATGIAKCVVLTLHFRLKRKIDERGRS